MDPFATSQSLVNALSQLANSGSVNKCSIEKLVADATQLSAFVKEREEQLAKLQITNNQAKTNLAESDDDLDDKPTLATNATSSNQRVQEQVVSTQFNSQYCNQCSKQTCRLTSAILTRVASDTSSSKDLHLKTSIEATGSIQQQFGTQSSGRKRRRSQTLRSINLSPLISAHAIRRTYGKVDLINAQLSWTQYNSQ